MTLLGDVAPSPFRAAAMAVVAATLMLSASCGSDDSTQAVDDLEADIEALEAELEHQSNTTLRPEITSTLGATTTSVAPTPPTTAAPKFTLRESGLGPVSFGHDAEAAIAELAAALGPPDSDSGWMPPGSVMFCIGSEERRVDFGALLVGLSRGESPYGTGPAGHVSGWAVSSGDVYRTEGGLGVGSHADEVFEAHATAVESEGDPGNPDTAIAVRSSSPELATGLLFILGPDRSVARLQAGACLYQDTH